MNSIHAFLKTKRKNICYVYDLAPYSKQGEIALVQKNDIIIQEQSLGGALYKRCTTLLKKRLRHHCFSANLAKFLKTAFLKIAKFLKTFPVFEHHDPPLIVLSRLGSVIRTLSSIYDGTFCENS